VGEMNFEIAGRRIGPGEPPYVVAEMSANHGADYRQAVAVLEAAVEAGVDAVKLQTFTADTLTIDSQSACFRIEGTDWDGYTLYRLYREAAMPWEWQPKLKRRADDLGVTLFSTPFDAMAVDFLETIDVPAYKVASFELIDLSLLRRVGQTGKPVLLSTGMATVDEIEEAIETVRAAGGGPIALLKCTSAYPATAESMHLRTIPDMAERFGVPIGLSDHTLDTTVPVAAVAAGACIVEKHVTLSRETPGLDRSFSLEPDELKQVVRAVRTAHAAMGSVRYGGTAEEDAGRRFRRSLFVVEDIRAGEAFTEQNVRSIRPAGGLAPRHLDDVLGRTARVDIARGTPLGWDDIK